MYKIAIDLDQTICTYGWPEYTDCKPYPEAKKFLNFLHKQKDKDGKRKYYIIIFTGRFMSRTEGNIYKAYSIGFRQIENWLKKYRIPYDEIIMGKPSFSLYICDKAFRINNDKGNKDWKSLKRKLNKLVK